MFISCSFARNIWRLVHFTFNIHPPTSISNMFGGWLNRVDKGTKARIRIGVVAILWAIWNCRNDIVFNKKIFFSLFAGYPQDGTLDTHVVLSTSCGQTWTHGYRLYTNNGGRTGYLQPEWVATS